MFARRPLRQRVASGQLGPRLAAEGQVGLKEDLHHLAAPFRPLALFGFLASGLVPRLLLPAVGFPPPRRWKARDPRGAQASQQGLLFFKPGSFLRVLVRQRHLKARER